MACGSRRKATTNCLLSTHYRLICNRQENRAAMGMPRKTTDKHGGAWKGVCGEIKDDAETLRACGLHHAFPLLPNAVHPPYGVPTAFFTGAAHAAIVPSPESNSNHAGGVALHCRAVVTDPGICAGGAPADGKQHGHNGRPNGRAGSGPRPHPQGLPRHHSQDGGPWDAASCGRLFRRSNGCGDCARGYRRGVWSRSPTGMQMYCCGTGLRSVYTTPHTDTSAYLKSSFLQDPKWLLARHRGT